MTEWLEEISAVCLFVGLFGIAHLIRFTLKKGELPMAKKAQKQVVAKKQQTKTKKQK